MIAEKVECDNCGLKASVKADGTYGAHSYQQHGRRVQCPAVGKLRVQHYGAFEVSQRDANGKAIEWVCNCRCRRAWVGPTYDAVDAEFLAHLPAVPPAEPGAGA